MASLATSGWPFSYRDSLATDHVWFATELNPLANGPSSNPLKLYWMLDEAVKTNDWNNAKIKDLAANLLVVIDQTIGTCDKARVQKLIDQIAAAPIEMFRPQLWRPDLTKVHSTRWDRTEAETTGTNS